MVQINHSIMNVETFHTDTILQKSDEIKAEIRKKVEDSQSLFDDGELCSLVQFLDESTKQKITKIYFVIFYFIPYFLLLLLNSKVP